MIFLSWAFKSEILVDTFIYLSPSLLLFAWLGGQIDSVFPSNAFLVAGKLCPWIAQEIRNNKDKKSVPIVLYWYEISTLWLSLSCFHIDIGIPRVLSLQLFSYFIPLSLVGLLNKQNKGEYFCFWRSCLKIMGVTKWWGRWGEIWGCRCGRGLGSQGAARAWSCLAALQGSPVEILQ